MKILHINSYFASSAFYRHLFKEQIKNGLDIKVFVPVSKSFDETFKCDDYISLSRNHRKSDRFIFHLKHWKILNDITKNYKIKDYDIIHAHSLFSNGYIAYKLYKKTNIPYIVAVRDTDLNVFFSKMVHLRRTGIKILQNAKSVIFLSTPYKEATINKYVPKRYQQNIKEKSLVIPNGIDSFWLRNRNKPKRLSLDKKIKLIYVGRISQRKNVLTSAKVCEYLIRNGFDIEFNVIGKIEDEKIFNKLKKYNFVNYFPAQPKEKLINFYRKNDIFIMPSITETFGLVYGEAMSQGLPVIYSKNQGFDGQIKEGLAGYPVNCFDVKEIAERIIDIINNYEQMSENSVKYCTKFDWKKITNQYISIYKRICY